MQRFLAITLLILSSNLYAENCTMSYGPGHFGYLFIPITQIRSKSEIDIKEPGILNEKTINTNRLLVEFGLPDVNSTVTIKNSSGLIDESKMRDPALLSELIKDPYINRKSATKPSSRESSQELYIYKTRGYSFYELEPGYKLKILGYKKVYTPADHTYLEYSIYALVRVTEC